MLSSFPTRILPGIRLVRFDFIKRHLRLGHRDPASSSFPAPRLYRPSPFYYIETQNIGRKLSNPPHPHAPSPSISVTSFGKFSLVAVLIHQDRSKLVQHIATPCFSFPTTFVRILFFLTVKEGKKKQGRFNLFVLSYNFQEAKKIR